MMKIRLSTIILFGFLFISTIVFVMVINHSYYTDQVGFNIEADSSTYYNAAKYWDFEGKSLVDLSYNYLGPIVILSLTGMSNDFVFVINVLLLIIGYLSLVANFQINRVKLLTLLFINPMVFASLLLVNKEILGLFSLVMFACYLESKAWKYLFLSLVFSLLTRWQELLVILIFMVVSSRVNPFHKNKTATLFVMIVSISLIYPIYLSQILGNVVSVDTLTSQAATAGDLIGFLNMLQDNFLFFVAIVPKIAANLFGNVFRLLDYVSTTNSVDYYDIYNNFIVLGHQITMLLLVVMLIRVRRLSVVSPIIYFSVIYSIVFSIGMMVQYRYFFPIYILFCLELAKVRNNPKHTISYDRFD